MSTARYLHVPRFFRNILPRVTSTKRFHLNTERRSLHVQYLIRVMIFREAIGMQHIHLRVSAAAVSPSCRVALHVAPLTIGSTRCDSLRIDMELHFDDEHELRGRARAHDARLREE